MNATITISTSSTDSHPLRIFPNLLSARAVRDTFAAVARDRLGIDVSRTAVPEDEHAEHSGEGDRQRDVWRQRRARGHVQIQDEQGRAEQAEIQDAELQLR